MPLRSWQVCIRPELPCASILSRSHMKNKWTCSWALLVFATSAIGQYRTALPGYRYEFPRDHFNHPDFRTEWWYYTGNLKSADGHRFGFELTFFRQGTARD